MKLGFLLPEIIRFLLITAFTLCPISTQNLSCCPVFPTKLA